MPGLATIDLWVIVINLPMQFSDEHQVLCPTEDLGDSFFLGRWNLEATPGRRIAIAFLSLYSWCISSDHPKGIEQVVQSAKEALPEILRSHQRPAESLIGLENSLDKSLNFMP